MDSSTGRQALNSRRFAFENCFERRIASPAFLNRLRKSEKSQSLLRIVVGATRNERLGKRRAGELGTAQKLEGSGRIVNFQNLTGAFPRCGVLGRSSCQLVILSRELESMDQ